MEKKKKRCSVSPKRRGTFHRESLPASKLRVYFYLSRLVGMLRISSLFVRIISTQRKLIKHQNFVLTKIIHLSFPPILGGLLLWLDWTRFPGIIESWFDDSFSNNSMVAAFHQLPSSFLIYFSSNYFSCLSVGYRDSRHSSEDYRVSSPREENRFCSCSRILPITSTSIHLVTSLFLSGIGPHFYLLVFFAICQLLRR